MFSQLANQVLLNDMRISLGGRDRSVSEKLLYDPDVHAVSQQECGDSVAQHVRRYVSLNSCVATELSNDVCHALS